MDTGARLRNSLYLRIIAPVIGSSPAWFAYGLALVYADIRRWLDRAKYQEVLLCLDHVMGSRIPTETRKRIAQNYLRNRACMRVDAMRLVGDGHHLMQLVTISGEEQLRKALDNGKGAVLCSAHYGSVRACGALLGARGFPLTMITAWSLSSTRLRGQKSQRLYQFAWKPLERHMRKPLDVRSTRISIAVQASNLLQRNEVVFSLLDTGASKRRKDAMTLDFIGGRATILPGPVLISKLTGAPLFMAFLSRGQSWKDLRLEIGPQIPVQGDALAATQACMTEVGRKITREPSQWEMWTMRRLVHLGLFPEEKASEYYKTTGRYWKKV